MNSYAPYDGRPLKPGDRYQLYSRGFQDGAGMKEHRYQGYADYEQGYTDGRLRLQEATTAFAAAVSYSPIILRLTKVSEGD